MFGTPRTPKTPSLRRRQESADTVAARAERLTRWCTLVGADPADIVRLVAAQAKEGKADGKAGTAGEEHGVLNQILLDVPRSCHFDECVRWSPAERDAHLAALERVLDAVFPSTNQHQFPFYVQGAHDVASVLLLAVGEQGAIVILPRLVAGPLRGFLQPTMQVPSALLQAVHTLIAKADPVLAEHLETHVGDHAAWALPWLLTWLSHTIDSLHAAITLFDGCVGQHPLRPVYMAACLALTARFRLLEAQEEGELMMVLQVLPRDLQVSDAQALLAGADALQHQYPPLALLNMLPPRARAVLAGHWPELWYAAVQDTPDGASHGGIVQSAVHHVRRARMHSLYWWAIVSGMVPPPPGTSKAQVLLPWQVRLSVGVAVLAILIARMGPPASCVTEGSPDAPTSLVACVVSHWGRRVHAASSLVALGSMSALHAGLDMLLRVLGVGGETKLEVVYAPPPT